MKVKPEDVQCVGGFWQPKYSVPNAAHGRGRADAGPHRRHPAGPGLHRQDHGRPDRPGAQGVFKAGENVLFLHTGGLPSLHAYERVVLGEHARTRAWLADHLATPTRRQAAWAVGVLALIVVMAVPCPGASARRRGSKVRCSARWSPPPTASCSRPTCARATASPGQVLAELSSQDLELERRRRESELRQHENGYRAAQARNDRAQMVVSQSRAAEAQALLSLVESQLERSRLEAPFDGIVIKGDLSRTSARRCRRARC
jgi:hypothetical protein